MSMNPGATTLFLASMVRLRGSAERTPIAAMRPSRIPTSPEYHGEPVPSMMCPLVMTRSKGPSTGPLTARSAAKEQIAKSSRKASERRAVAAVRFIGANYKASRRLLSLIFTPSGDCEAMRVFRRRAQDADGFFQRRNFKQWREMGRLQNPSEENRGIHQLQFRRLLHRPATHEQQRSQTSSVKLGHFGNVEHEHSDALKLLNPA